ncbi:unnamed protein product [Zymoseptoria tritici ST99CH_3D1]|uniref:Rab-GAP TBC domain-containing protein n=1 Tax=Zymoseptoria tritici (strain ST99CH_3D7) TaxID=1276538 RepID=A0A1X7RYL8_ZYMT9|nr:unnamed protein product [Zymoseptoria tritici ST99CH_3D7]SMR57498.1 unnamed protein product [Zymoseptoria tritici ST99CH_3D1]
MDEDIATGTISRPTIVRLPSTSYAQSRSPSTNFEPLDDDASHRDRAADGHDRIIHIHGEYDFLRALITGDAKTVRSGLESEESERAVKAGLGLKLDLELPKAVCVAPRRMSKRSISSPVARSRESVVLEDVAEEETAPSSPPELSYSKSSKSSSSSSNNSDEDELEDAGIASSKTRNFEEVQLAGDEREDNNLPPGSRPTLRKPAHRSFTTGATDASAAGSSRGSGGDAGGSKARWKGDRLAPLRSMPNGNRSQPNLQVNIIDGVLRDQSLNLPHGRRSMQRATSSPISPFARMSRTPSPNKPFISGSPSATSPQANGRSPSFEGSIPHRNAPGTLARSVSWQPGRKSVQELEAECNDEDEEVPDDAILENVPISPLPGQHLSAYKSPNVSATSLLRSPTPSPHRRPSYAGLHSANIPKGAKRPSAPPLNGQNRPTRSPKYGRPRMPHSATAGSFPAAERLHGKQRSRSWHEHLNDEARELSQALEEHASRRPTESKSHTADSTPSSSPPRTTAKPVRSITSPTEFPSVPALQKGNIMIDPLPISKEKEAVLSRTRPSWLPPKDQKEEKRHLREFQQMMARAAEAEKKRLLKMQENREMDEEVQGSVARIWDQHVLPNWDAVMKEPRTRELWWRGVTSRSRGEVWQKAVGNELELSPASYDAALERARALEEKLGDLPEEELPSSKELAWFEAIDRDVTTVFPELNMFQHGAPLHDALGNVLKAYAMYRSDIGYVYGTHLVAGMVCMHVPPATAFVLLANLLNRPLPHAFLVHDRTGMQRAYELTLHTLRYKFSRLHDHITSETIGLHPEEFLDPMFRCLFANNLPHEHVARIWDLFVFEGDKALVRAAVAAMGILEPKLYGNREEILGLIGWQNESRWSVGTENEFVEAVREAGKVDQRRSASA